MSFGTRLKERRESLGLSRAELAHSLNVTPAAIGNYENEVSSPKEEILYRIFSALNVEPNYLWQDEMEHVASDFLVSYPEQEYIKKYRSLDDHGKEMVDTVLNLEHDRCTAPSGIGLVARGGVTVKPTREARQDVLERLVQESQAAADIENERY